MPLAKIINDRRFIFASLHLCAFALNSAATLAQNPRCKTPKSAYFTSEFSVSRFD